jgi:hypothetical protein
MVDDRGVSADRMSGSHAVQAIQQRRGKKALLTR